MNPFEFLKSINNSKKDVMENEKDYIPFMVNRGLSYFPDTVLYANEMNRYHHLDKRLQYDFLINIVRKRNRFSKWHKVSKSEDIDAIKSYYNYSNEKAQDVLPLFNNGELRIIKEMVNHGGTKR